MFRSKKKKKVVNAFKLLAEAGYSTAEWFQHEESLQWHPAPLWNWFCGTIPAFAILISCENNRSQNRIETQVFLKSIEEYLFVFYKEQSPNALAPLNLALPIVSERQKVCEMYNAPENMNMGVVTILGIIFPGRLDRYQQDFQDGLQSDNFDAPFCFLAMRLAADLTGIPTPNSLVGYSADDLGITAYGNALAPLINFATEYQNTV